MTEPGARASVRSMKTRAHIFAFCLTAGLLTAVSACTSVPVDPCSKAGVEQRLSKSLRSYASENRGDLKALKQVTQYLGGESVTGKMQIVFALDALSRLASNFQADVMPEIASISRQCGTTDNVKEVFLDFLRDEGVNGKVLKWVEGLDLSLDDSKI